MAREETDEGGESSFLHEDEPWLQELRVWPGVGRSADAGKADELLFFPLACCFRAFLEEEVVVSGLGGVACPTGVELDATIGSIDGRPFPRAFVFEGPG